MLINIALLRRFGFLALTVDFMVISTLGQIPLTASGWLGERVLPFQLIPIALAGWALWVILSARSVPEAGGEAVV